MTRAPASAAAGHVLGQGSHFWLRESVGPPARPAGRSPLVSRSLGTFSLVTGLHLLLPRPLGALLGNVPRQSQIGVQRPRLDTRVALAVPGNPRQPGASSSLPRQDVVHQESSGTRHCPGRGEPKPCEGQFLSFSRVTQAGHPPGGAPAASCRPHCPGRGPSRTQVPRQPGVGAPASGTAGEAADHPSPASHQPVVTAGRLSTLSWGPGRPSRGTSVHLPPPAGHIRAVGAERAAQSRSPEAKKGSHALTL